MRFFALFFLFAFLCSCDISVKAVPFGLPAGTKIPVKKRVVFPEPDKDAEQDLQRADDLLAAGAYAAAYIDYQQLLFSFPDLQQAIFGAAYSLLAAGSTDPEQLAKARNYTEILAAKKVTYIQAQLLASFILEKSGNEQHALKVSKYISEKSPTYAEARLRYAELLLNDGQYELAITEASYAVSLFQGKNSKAYSILAMALHNVGLLDSCSKLLNYALPRFPSQTDLLILSGYLNEYAGKYDSAEKLYKKALALQPDNSEAINALVTMGEKNSPNSTNKGSMERRIKLKDIMLETVLILEPLVEEYPENLPLREALGKIYLKARVMTKAREQFLEIYNQDPGYPKIRSYMESASEEIPVNININHAPVENDKVLADSLAANIAALRSSDFREDRPVLGHYLVHYEASYKDFFSKHSITRFRKINDTDFEEIVGDGTVLYKNRVLFDKKKKFYGVVVSAIDTASMSSSNRIVDLFGYLLKKNSGILGEGIAAIGVCDSARWEGVIWTSRDNFEIIMQNSKNNKVVYNLKLNAKRFDDNGNLCSYVPIVLGRSKTPIKPKQ